MSFQNKLIDDHTPRDFEISDVDNRIEKLKQIVRYTLYPVVNALVDPLMRFKFRKSDLKPDMWFYGQRGNDLERHRRRLNAYYKIKDRRVLVIGCGTGRDLPSWGEYRPKSILGIDFFCYRRAWEQRQRQFLSLGYPTDLEFSQLNVEDLSPIASDSIDIVGSDAVLEHLKNIPTVLAEFFRVLKPGGVVYANFGPLWHSWGGDHISGYDSISSGFNHLILKKDEYKKYLEGINQAHVHSEQDGRTWVLNDMFSYLRAEEYLQGFEMQGFKIEFYGLLVDPRGQKALKSDFLRRKLLKKFNVLDLLISGMSIICRKPLEASSP